jgi:hypothetical protein
MMGVMVVAMLRRYLKDSYMIVMKESMSDMVLDELSKGVYKVKASLKKRSSFTPLMY